MPLENLFAEHGPGWYGVFVISCFVWPWMRRKWLERRGRANELQIDRRRPLPRCRVRPMEESDHARCIELYQLNEIDRFPEGGVKEFLKWLRQENSRLALVIEVKGKLIGFGGVSLHQREDGPQYAYLTFGMIDPAYHRQGYGTVNLLARLAALPQPVRPLLCGMSTVESSRSFYAQFNFQVAGHSRYEDGTLLSVQRACLTTSSWATARAFLEEDGIELHLENREVPITVDPSS